MGDRLSPGDTAPDFTLPDDTGSPVTLGDLRGGKVIVYFYPAAMTPGCTTQACGIRDHERAYDTADAVVLGVSPDPPERLVKFADKHALGFTLLSDPDHKVADAYGVWVEKSMYGRTYMGVERSTFVIGPDGRLAHALYKVRPKGHAASVLELVG